jgi:hypothetical protein
MRCIFSSRQRCANLTSHPFRCILLPCIALINSVLAEAETLLLDGPPSTAEPSPHWRKPPQHSRWEISFHTEPAATDPSSGSDVKYKPHRVTVTRHGVDMLQEVLMEDGKRWETWILGQVQIQSIAGSDNVWIKPPHSKSERFWDATDHHSFGEFHWIRKEHFRGTFPIQGTRAAVFLYPLDDRSEGKLQLLRSSKKGPLGGLPLCEGILAAAIHPDTRYPILLQQGSVLRTYAITPLAQDVLTLPEKVIRFRQFLTAPARVSPRPLP